MFCLITLSNLACICWSYPFFPVSRMLEVINVICLITYPINFWLRTVSMSGVHKKFVELNTAERKQIHNLKYLFLKKSIYYNSVSNDLQLEDWERNTCKGKICHFFVGFLAQRFFTNPNGCMHDVAMQAYCMALQSCNISLSGFHF